MARMWQYDILCESVSRWNIWRQDYPDRRIALSGANLSGANLCEANLSGANLCEANLCEANFSGANLCKADLRDAYLCEANFSGANLCKANLCEADLRDVHLSGANLCEANLSGANLSGANLCGANLSKADLSLADLRDADLSEANLCEANLCEANLSGANLCAADLRGADLRISLLDFSRVDLGYADLRDVDLRGAHLDGVYLVRANLSGANLSGATLSRAHLSGANLSGANLSKADLSLADLNEANLKDATLTDAWLWETHRVGWSIQGILCEATYWDKNRRERVAYTPGEFERLHSDNIKIVLHYEGGISPIEIATLPAMIQRIADTHPGCVVRLRSIYDAPGGATVTLVVEEVGEGNTADIIEQLEESTKQLQAVQRYALAQADMRRQAEYALKFFSNELFSKLLEQRPMGQSGNQFNIGSVSGDILGSVHDNAQVTIRSTITYTTNDLASIDKLVSEMFIYRTELSLDASQRTQFEAQLKAIQEQLATQAPNHSLLREALHTMRHILEAGVAHVLVGHWPEIMHTLQSLTRV